MEELFWVLVGLGGPYWFEKEVNIRKGTDRSGKGPGLKKAWNERESDRPAGREPCNPPSTRRKAAKRFLDHRESMGKNRPQKKNPGRGRPIGKKQAPTPREKTVGEKTSGTPKQKASSFPFSGPGQRRRGGGRSVEKRLLPICRGTLFPSLNLGGTS